MQARTPSDRLSESFVISVFFFFSLKQFSFPLFSLHLSSTHACMFVFFLDPADTVCFSIPVRKKKQELFLS